MTLLPFRRKRDISPEDELDTWLNARTSGLNETPSQLEGEGLAGVANEFHAWADSVQERDASAKGPADDLWNRILHEQRVEQRRSRERADEMSTTIGAPVGGYAPPRSNRTRRAEATPLSSRAGAWFNAIAAALLVLTLGGGAYLARNGGFGFGGGGGDESGRYAAQVGSPMASPEGGLVVETNHVCDVPGYTEEQAWRIVMNPEYGYQWLMSGEEPNEPPSEMWEDSVGFFNIVEAWGVDREQGWPPEQSTYGEMAADADTFWACLNAGTSLQVWSLMDPSVMQSEILSNFKALRSEEDIRGYISTFGNMRYSAALSHAFPDFGGLDNPIRNAVASPNPGTARVIDSGGRDPLAWVRMVREDEAEMGAQTYLVMREFRPGIWIAVAHQVEGGLG